MKTQTKPRYNYKRDKAYKQFEREQINSMQWATNKQSTHSGAPTMKTHNEIIDRVIIPVLGFVAIVVIWLTA